MNPGNNGMGVAAYVAQLEAKLEAMTQQAHLVTQYLSAMLTKQGWDTYALNTADMEAAYDRHGFRLKTDWQPHGDGESRVCIINTVDFTPEELAQIKASREEAEAKMTEARDNAALVETLASVGCIVPLDVAAEWSTFQWMIAEGWAQKRLDDPTTDVPPHLGTYMKGDA